MRCWKALLVTIGNVPSAAVVMTGFAIGAATSWAGWQAGKRPAVPAGAAAQPAYDRKRPGRRCAGLLRSARNDKLRP